MAFLPLVSALVALGSMIPSASAARQPYDVHKIIDSFRHPHDDLVILCAHRGSRWNGTADNSREAYFRSTQSGIECIETDIRLSLDMHLMMLHDSGLGRETDVGEFTDQQAYNPFTGQGFNPLVSESNYTNFMQHLHLRDEGGRVHRETLPTLPDMIQSIHDTGANVVLQLDFKEKAAVPAAYYALKSLANAAGVPANEWCIYKTQASWWKTPEEFEKEQWVQDAFASNISLALLPVYQPEDSWMWDTEGSIRAFQKTNYTISAEVELRSEGGALQRELDLIRETGEGDGGFNTAGIFFAIGDFVTPISSAFYDTANFSLPTDERTNNSVYFFQENLAPVLRDSQTGNETLDGHDYRSDFAWILERGFTWVITDTADVWDQSLRGEGKRNISRLLADEKGVDEGLGRGWYV